MGEKETLGFYVSSDPLTKWSSLLKAFSTCTTAAAGELEDGSEVQIGGILTSAAMMVVKAGQNAGKKIGRLKLRDFSGAMEATAFPKELERFADLLVEDKIVFLRGRVDRFRDEPSLRVSDVIPVDKVREVCSQRVLIRLKEADEKILEKIKATVTTYPGACELYFQLPAEDGSRVTLATGSQYRFAPQPEVVARLEEIAGPGGVIWKRRDLDGGPDPRKMWKDKAAARASSGGE